MRYICLVYHAESALHGLSSSEGAKLDADSLAYDRKLQAEGHLVVAEALQSVRTAKTVRKRAGKVLVSDGPFAETKEQLLGFVMIEAGGMDEAVALAADIPLASMGMVEVRAIYDIPVPDQ
ncbi:YciI family protein [Ollibium composti]|uniref:YciI family protein n=1 Tax=Ollibium composti TaxID=2675109 RepID=A0ABY2Q7S8_9HYPH|nr:YciI family protein [Mesorhizobium composti]THF57368.1 YciI family protein [Mesorhizobium composti]